MISPPIVAYATVKRWWDNRHGGAADREDGRFGRQAHLAARIDVGGDTFGKLLARNARVRGDKPAMRFKTNGVWRSWTWREVETEARGLAAG